ncbi:hypothetical protein [Ramlibacter tataouinensis]|uniref:Uncharacterized protein n=1 Tax=Ramlibacter tataouinensis (strain ATCC BAA-407 / DSM 14655 / LMG 21543 / TTB310) TaxID=365046 RepID=F5Y083_RAMTT|nr:hypothetical protein [Ramlibacter tataouinensis]AEG92105.1 hypothetical protein Rta_10210 [Ramlibacter tataouinensis TTB310]
MTPRSDAQGGADAKALADACRALWLATLSLMTAFMQTRAPAHRYLLARRIAGNFGTLHREHAAFAPDSGEAFSRLAARWQRTADEHAPGAPAPRRGLSLASLLKLH